MSGPKYKRKFRLTFTVPCLIVTRAPSVIWISWNITRGPKRTFTPRPPTTPSIRTMMTSEPVLTRSKSFEFSYTWNPRRVEA